jgi:hypothetical protein
VFNPSGTRLLVGGFGVLRLLDARSFREYGGGVCGESDVGGRLALETGTTPTNEELMTAATWATG